MPRDARRRLATTARLCSLDGRSGADLVPDREDHRARERDRRDLRPPDRHRDPVAGPRRHPRVRRRLGDRPVRRRPRGRRPVERDDHGHRRGRGGAAAAADAAADPRRQPGRPRRGRDRRRASIDGVFPDGFYSTTNLETRVRLDGQLGRASRTPRWTAAWSSTTPATPLRVYTLPMSDVKAGMQVVCGASGIRVDAPVLDQGARSSFGFMESDVSSEKPQAVLVRQVADGMREAKAAGKKVLWVGGPGVVHTGAAPAMVALVDAGLRRRAVRRQRAGHPRHRVVAVRHVARRRPGPGPRRRARPRAPHPRAQHDPQGGLDRGRRRPGRADRRHHARAGHRRQGVRAGRLGARRRAAARRLHRRARGPAGDARRARPTSASA